jgi:hypothetical protein
MIKVPLSVISGFAEEHLFFLDVPDRLLAGSSSVSHGQGILTFSGTAKVIDFLLTLLLGGCAEA